MVVTLEIEVCVEYVVFCELATSLKSSVMSSAYADSLIVISNGPPVDVPLPPTAATISILGSLFALGIVKVIFALFPLPLSSSSL